MENMVKDMYKKYSSNLTKEDHVDFMYETYGIKNLTDDERRRILNNVYNLSGKEKISIDNLTELNKRQLN